MSRFAPKILTTQKTLKSLMDVPRKSIDRARQDRSLANLILDLDSSVREAHGHPERLSSPVGTAGHAR